MPTVTYQVPDATLTEREVPFVRLDPEGFDHVVVAGERFRIPNGLEKFRARLVRRFPDAERPLRRYFEVIEQLGRELDGLDIPSRITPAAWRTPCNAPASDRTAAISASGVAWSNRNPVPPAGSMPRSTIVSARPPVRWAIGGVP